MCAKVLEQIYKTDRSESLFKEASNFIVGGVASKLHKAPYEKFPVYLERGVGSHLFDVDGNEYIDYVGGFGPMILGFSPKEVNEAVKAQVDLGSQFASPVEKLNSVSRMIIDALPCAERVTFQGTGTEAVMVALRFARAYTGKNKIIKFEGNYHGWSDEVYVSTDSDSIKMMGPRNMPWKTLGVAGQRLNTSDDVIVLPYNDLEIFENYVINHYQDLAAVILEPIMCNCEVVFPEEGYLLKLREITEKYNILLIFDEIITGFRLSLGGAQKYFGITPDLCTFGKAVAGGYPLAGVAGKRGIMESGVQPVGTFNANPIVLAACSATLNILKNENIYKQMQDITNSLVTGVQLLAKKYGITLYAQNAGSIWQMAFGIDEPLKDYRDNFLVNKKAYQDFRVQCRTKGINFHPSRGRFYTSAAHTKNDVDKTLEVIEEVFSTRNSFYK